ncbi:aspartate ammonia-lyase [Rhodococcus rhodochrous]|uniref:aspartate ammonia-lyase n=1 Tax=Rhodococcus rhodochrous KG-21 TaxID=1441923 RepID=A0A0N0S0C4_RHORH|nr:aspartate ammonia-lyase [Rhodococcus rhodochrous]KOS53720.1 aspartate ammonia-lyase [Rhodococcus rhodochrous KG-21]
MSSETSSPAVTRTEYDLLGYRELPGDVYWGIHTLRARENFPIAGTPISTHPDLITALGFVKQAAALTNLELGLLPADKGTAIAAACAEITNGELHDQFVVDVIQGGAGTSTNMNANEVIANRALEILGYERGAYHIIHPVDDVNRCQSTNDVYPTSIKVAVLFSTQRLRDAMRHLSEIFGEKSVEFSDIIKMGRTQLQDAVPMTLGQEFGTYQVMIDEDISRLTESASLLRELNLGATAIGTGLNAPPRYGSLACAHLGDLTGLPVGRAENLIEATQDVGAFVHFSGVLKRIAVKISKICNDLRLLSSGPRSGLGEINLPAVQAGSSIMPGKVNPVIPEVVNQVAFEVIGNDVTISFAAESGQLQLNAFEPIIAHRTLESMAHLVGAFSTLADRCVSGITANTTHLARTIEHSAGLATALNPHIGYAAATSVASEALRTGRSVVEIVAERALLTPEQLRDILSPSSLVGHGSNYSAGI